MSVMHVQASRRVHHGRGPPRTAWSRCSDQSGNRSATRLLSRLREKERFDAAVGASDWNAAALVLSDFDKGDTAPALGSLDVNQLRYLDDAVNRHHGWKGGESLSAQVRGAMELQGVDADRTKAGQGYGKAWGKYGKVVDGKNGSKYTLEVDLYFEPDPDLVGADEISWIQTVRTIDTATLISNEPGTPDRARTTDKQWMVDRMEKKKYGWYGIHNDTTANANVHPWLRSAPTEAAHLWDQPGWTETEMVWDVRGRRRLPDPADPALPRRPPAGTGSRVGRRSTRRRAGSRGHASDSGLSRPEQLPPADDAAGSGADRLRRDTCGGPCVGARRHLARRDLPERLQPSRARRRSRRPGR